jgi:hypothetical protein
MMLHAAGPGPSSESESDCQTVRGHGIGESESIPAKPGVTVTELESDNLNPL